jgi:hypothetical protein
LQLKSLSWFTIGRIAGWLGKGAQGAGRVGKWIANTKPAQWLGNLLNQAGRAGGGALKQVGDWGSKAVKAVAGSPLGQQVGNALGWAATKGSNAFNKIVTSSSEALTWAATKGKAGLKRGQEWIRRHTPEPIQQFIQGAKQQGKNFIAKVEQGKDLAQAVLNHPRVGGEILKDPKKMALMLNHGYPVLKKYGPRDGMEMLSEGVIAKRVTPEGHTLKVLPNGKLIRCSTCEELRDLLKNRIPVILQGEEKIGANDVSLS